MTGKKWNNAVQSREEQNQKKRHAVLLAGAKLFCDKGYERTSLDDIADELNITKRTIYYYVQSKDEILFECMKAGLTFIEGVAERHSDPAVAPLDRIHAMIGEYIDWVSTDFGACLALIKDSVVSEPGRTKLRKSKLALDLRLRDLIEEGIQDRSIRPCKPQLISAAIFGALNWLPFWNRNSHPVSNADLRKEFGDYFLQGLIQNPKR